MFIIVWAHIVQLLLLLLLLLRVKREKKPVLVYLNAAQFHDSVTGIKLGHTTEILMNVK